MISRSFVINKDYCCPVRTDRVGPSLKTKDGGCPIIERKVIDLFNTARYPRLNDIIPEPGFLQKN